MASGVICFGDSPRRAAALAMWARRYETYGPTGCRSSADGRRVNAARVGRLNRKTHCKRGHKLVESNLYVRTIRGRGTVRDCRACWILRDQIARARRVNQPAWAAKWRRLRDRQVAAHPDKGGTPKKFIAATKRLKAFERLYAKQPWITTKELR